MLNIYIYGINYARKSVTQNINKMQKSKLTFWQMWNISFGFFGVQIA